MQKVGQPMVVEEIWRVVKFLEEVDERKESQNKE
jgi:hypothetical protein